MLTGRERWFADILQAGLDTRLLVESDILTHVTPAVLAQSMPRDVMVRLFDAALASGTISPEAIVKTATPELLAEHVPPKLVWACFAGAAERAGITKGTDDPQARELVRRALDTGLRAVVLTPEDVVRHVDAKVLGNFPDALTTRILEVSLAAGRMTPELIVETLGADSISKHAATNIVWACLAEAGAELLAETTQPAPKDAFSLGPVSGSATAPKPTLEFLDDDVASVLVDLDDSTPPKKDPKRGRAPSA